MVQNKTNLDLEIILLLLKKPTHLRELSRLLNQSHSTILRKLNLLSEKNITDYKKEGKNKIFFLKNNLQAKTYIALAENYKLTKLLEFYPKLNVIIQDILSKTKEKLIILFGSYAKFIGTENSDIDIYVKTTNTKTKNKLQELNSKISIKTGKFNPSSLLIKEIIKNHVILRGVEEFYEKNEFFE